MEKLIRLIILLTMFFLGVVGPTFEAKGAEFTLRFAGNLPVTYYVTKGQELLAKLIEERTGGRVKVPVYPAGQLFSDKDMMKAVPSGAVEMGEITTAPWTGLVPSLLVIDLPLFFNDRPHVFRALDGEAGEIIKRDLERVGVKLLHWMDGGGMELASKMPVRRLEDFKGKRIRVHGEMIAESTRALGAAPTFLGGGEVYMALQRGTVDGAFSGITSFWERKYFEVSKYLTVFDLGPAMFAVVINLKKWNELPPDIQKVILASSREVQEWGNKEALKVNKECLELLKQNGMEVIVIPEKERERWREACLEPVKAVFLKRAGETGQRLIELAEKAR